MKNLQITKLKRVENTDTETTSNVIAFQLVKFTYKFYGNEMETILDTKILKDGNQVVIDGDGFIPAGFIVK